MCINYTCSSSSNVIAITHAIQTCGKLIFNLIQSPHLFTITSTATAVEISDAVVVVVAVAAAVVVL